MALIRFSNLVNDIRGSSGGNTFSRGLAGATVSMKRTVSVPEGRSFRKSPSPVSVAAKLWRTLSESQRSAWIDAARGISVKNRLGLVRPGSAFEMFSQSVAARLAVGYSPMLDFISYEGIGAFSATDLTFRLSDQRIYQTPADITSPAARSVSFATDVLDLSYAIPKDSAFVFISAPLVNIWARTDYSAGVFSNIFPDILTSSSKSFLLKNRVVLQDYSWPVYQNTAPVLIVP